MKIKNNYIVSVLVCTVLFLASCAEDEMADGTHSQKQDLRTVSVNFDMPADKPSFGDGTASRAALDAQPAEILLGDSTLAVSRAEGAEGGTSYYTTSDWADNDQLLVRIEAGSIQARLTLKYYDPAEGTAYAWYLIKANSYVTYTGTAFSAYNAQDVTPLFAEDTYGTDADMPISGTLTMHIDYTSTATQAEVSIIYAPDMKWSLAQVDNTVSMKQKANATTQTTAPELWTVAGNAWTTNQARLRVNTGTRNAGDVVTLTSSAFDSAWEVEPTEGEGENAKTVYTAVTDDYGDAYFYGATVDAQGNPSALTDGFLVQLTKMRVAVPQPAAPPSETRSIALDNAKKNFIITLDEPITLLEASDVVPVTLAAKQAYKLMAEDKRTASAQANLSVIDGSCEDLEFITKQIKTALAANITEFTVINELAAYNGESTEAKTVVGEAIRTCGATNGSIFLTLADETEVPESAFKACHALQSVSAPIATTIAGTAFQGCTSLTSLTFGAVVTTVGDNAFNDANTTNCDLTLHADQQAETSTLKVTAVNGQLMWAGKAWKSIKVGETQYAAVGNLLCELRDGVPVKVIDGTTYAVIDGQHDYSVTSVVVNNAVGLTPAITNFYVINQLPAYTSGTAGTVVGEAIYQLAPSVNPASTRAANFTGEISLVLADATSVPDKAFYNCAVLKTVEVGNNVPNNEITLGANAFGYATITTSVTFHKVVTGAGLTNAFTGATITNCTLYLNAEQRGISMTWAGAAWQSITLSDDTKYTIGNGVPTVEVDGAIGGKTSIVADDVTDMKSKIKVVADAAATTNVSAKVIVKNELAAYTNETENDIYAGTVVGEAIRLLTPELQPMGAETVNYKGRITLTLDNATELPQIAFAYCEALQSVTAPAVTTIGENAFALCSALTSVSLPEATNIGASAFASSRLTGELSLPAAETIGVAAFQSCTALTSVSLPNATTIRGSAFQSCTRLTSVSLPNATTIRDIAFQGCTVLTTVLFGTAVTSLGNDAFDGVPTEDCDLTLHADQLNHETYPVSASNDGKLMWAGAEWKSITVGDKVYTQETGFVKLTIGGTDYAVIDGMCGKKEGHEANDVTAVKLQIKAAVDARINDFYVVNQLGTYEKIVIIERPGREPTSLNVNTSVVGEAITAFANENTGARVSITLADATTVPESAFEGCTALSGINLNNATSIGNSAFNGCTALSGINLNNATSIGESAFYGCTALSDINWDKVASIGEYAFEGCTALTSVTTAATQIGDNAFYGCTNLQSATFTSDNTEIGHYAFYGCTKLTTLSWNKVTSIGDYAFSGCEALVEVLSSTVTTVGNFAFRYCASLKTVSLPEVTTLGNAVFRSCASLTKLTLGKVTSVNLDQYTHSFKEFNTEGCDLTLGAGQGGLSPDDDISDGIWAGMQWKSITVGGEQKYSSANAQANQ